MKLLSSLCLLLVTLVGVSVQHCTIEWFEDVVALDTLESTTSDCTDRDQDYHCTR